MECSHEFKGEISVYTLSTSGSNLLSVGMFVYWCRETVEVWVEGKACEEIADFLCFEGMGRSKEKLKVKGDNSEFMLQCRV